MTISHQTRANQVIKTTVRTLLNLSTRKRSFMVLLNPDSIIRADWNTSVNVAGFSFVYLSLEVGA